MLDPEIARHLEAFPVPELDIADVATVRALAAGYMADRGGPAPLYCDPQVHVVHERIEGVPVIVWTPAHATARCPVVIAFHGGGFIVGDPLGAERIAFPLARDHGVITVSVGYRLAPEHRAPAQLDDGASVLRAVRRSPNLLGSRIDAGHIALHGSSAGGCIAAGLAQLARDEGIPLALQSLSSPVLDDRAAIDCPSDHSMLGPSPTWSRQDTCAAWQHYLGSDRPPPPYVVPARTHDLSGVATAHITVAQYDVLRDEALEYARRLWESGVSVTVDRPAGTVHGFDGLMPESAVAQRAIARQVRALAAALR